jgi:hypothetical protein
MSDIRRRPSPAAPNTPAPPGPKSGEPGSTISAPKEIIDPNTSSTRTVPDAPSPGIPHQDDKATNTPPEQRPSGTNPGDDKNANAAKDPERDKPDQQQPKEQDGQQGTKDDKDSSTNRPGAQHSPRNKSGGDSGGSSGNEYPDVPPSGRELTIDEVKHYLGVAASFVEGSYPSVISYLHAVHAEATEAFNILNEAHIIAKALTLFPGNEILFNDIDDIERRMKKMTLAIDKADECIALANGYADRIHGISNRL